MSRMPLEGHVFWSAPLDGDARTHHGSHEALLSGLPSRLAWWRHHAKWPQHTKWDPASKWVLVECNGHRRPVVSNAAVSGGVRTRDQERPP
jgi:hypothetical protein